MTRKCCVKSWAGYTSLRRSTMTRFERSSCWCTTSLRCVLPNDSLVPLSISSFRYSGDRSETSLRATRSPNSTRQSARSMLTSWMGSAKKSIGGWSNSTRCSSFWTRSCRWRMGRRSWSRGRGGGSGECIVVLKLGADALTDTATGDRRA